MIKSGREFAEVAGLGDILPIWGSVFNAVGIISNRKTPLHRDCNTRPQWYDLLTTVGDYATAEMSLPTLGLRLKYDRGTVVAFSGRMLRHGVCKVDGDRQCVVWYMHFRTPILRVY